jgi:hypothetical protein
VGEPSGPRAIPTATQQQAAAMRGLNQCIEALLQTGLTAVEVLGLLRCAQRVLEDRVGVTLHKMSRKEQLVQVADGAETAALTREPLPS